MLIDSMKLNRFHVLGTIAITISFIYSVIPSQLGAVPLPQENQQYAIGDYVEANQVVNLRASASANSADLGDLHPGMPVEILSMEVGQSVSGNSLWLFVRVEEDDFYVWSGGVHWSHRPLAVATATAVEVNDLDEAEARADFWNTEILRGSEVFYAEEGLTFRLDRSWNELPATQRPVFFVPGVDDEPHIMLWAEDMDRSHLMVWREYNLWLMAKTSQETYAGSTFETFLANRVGAQERGENLTLTLLVTNILTGEPVEVEVPLGTVTWSGHLANESLFLVHDAQGRVSWSGHLVDQSLTLEVDGGVKFDITLGRTNSSQSVSARGLRLAYRNGSSGTQTQTGIYVNPDNPSVIQVLVAVPSYEEPLKMNGPDSILTPMYMMESFMNPLYYLSLNRETTLGILHGEIPTLSMVPEMNLSQPPYVFPYWNLFIGLDQNGTTNGFFAIGSEAQYGSTTE